MSLFLTILKYVIALLPSIFSIVQSAEAAFSGIPNVSGAAKKDLAMGVIGAALAAAPVSPEESAAVSKAAGLVVDSTVASLNAVGVFKKDNTAPTSAVVVPPPAA